MFHISERLDYVCTRFNQTTVAYDASKEVKVKSLEAKKAEVTERLRDKS